MICCLRCAEMWTQSCGKEDGCRKMHRLKRDRVRQIEELVLMKQRRAPSVLLWFVGET